MLPTQTILQPVQIATYVPGTETQIKNSILTLLSSSRRSLGESRFTACLLGHIPDASLPSALPTQTWAFCRIPNEQGSLLWCVLWMNEWKILKLQGVINMSVCLLGNCVSSKMKRLRSSRQLWLLCKKLSCLCRKYLNKCFFPMGFLEELLPRVDPSVQISNFTLESPGRGSRWSHLRNANAVWHLLAHCLSSADRRIHQDAVIMDQRHSECSERRANAVRAPFRRSETMLAVLLALWSRSHLFPRLTVCFQGQSHSQSSGLHPCHQTAAWMLCVAVVMASLETLTLFLVLTFMESSHDSAPHLEHSFGVNRHFQRWRHAWAAKVMDLKSHG